MLMGSILSLACCHSDSAQTIVDTSCELQGQAEQTMALCTTARSLGDKLVTTSRDIGNDLGDFGSKLDVSVFGKLADFVQKNQTRDAMDAVTGMDDLAQQILDHVGRMDDSLTKSIDSLPDHLKQDFESEEEEGEAGATKSRSMGVDDEVDEDELLKELSTVDADIADLDNSCTKTRGGIGGSGGLNLFSASSTGRSVFEGTTSKGERCQLFFGKMAELCRAVTNLMKAIVSENCCCAKMRAILSGIASLFRCRHLLALLRRVAEAVVRLVKAIGQVIGLAFGRIQGFLEEFDAAKKLGRFAKKVKNSNVGKLASGLMSSILPSGGGGGTSRS